MADTALMLTEEERKFLADFLEMCLKDTQVEEHRTRTISYRDHLLHREHLIGSLLQKLGKTSG